MTNLQCTAKNCSHNDDNCCCLNTVKVGGESACTCGETSCDSYCEKGSFASNFMPQGAAHPETHVNCSAITCEHNRDNACQARSITVDAMGTSKAGNTECSSYSPKA